MRDLLPQEADQEARVSRRVMECFELCGYQRVSVPAFELAQVMEKWLGAAESSAMLRFVDPESGEVVALRPDMTPQVARLVATRLRTAPSPVRLCYQGSVLRRRHERSRRRRQIQQLGLELIGMEALAGDLEVLETATSAVRAAGLAEFTLDIGHAAIATSLIDGLPAESRSALVEALTLKDSTKAAQLAQSSGAPSAVQKALAALPELHGGDEIWAKATAVFKGTPAEAPAAVLRQIWDWAARANVASTLMVDLGELRKLDYYTGLTFQILAHGPGEAVGSGGRYDRMFEQFAAARPAAGFAIDLGNLCWALNDAGQHDAVRKRVLVTAGGAASEGALLAEVCQQLRRQGVACALAASGAAQGSLDEYSAAWRYDAILELAPGKAQLRLLSPARVVSGEAKGAADVAAWVSKVLVD
jgi:ATP phosphoribosyltransferase regulatory subunit